MASPKYKIYDADNVYQASCKDPVAAAALVSAIYHGGTVRFDHSKSSIVWTEGAEDFSAGESYDMAVEVMAQRERSIQRAAYEAMKERQRKTFPKGWVEELDA